VDVARLIARVRLILGIIGTEDKQEPDRTNQARSLATEALLSLNGKSGDLITAEEASAINAKVTAGEALILDQLPLEYLLSGLRESCMEILALTQGTNGECAAQDSRFVSENLNMLNSQKIESAETARRLYLQARERVDVIFATRVALIDTAHRFMSSLWLRTVAAILFCSIPVVFFAYDYWSWHPDEYSKASSENTGSPAENFDVEAAKKALAVFPGLREELAKLPTAAVKAKLDLQDARKFMASAIYRENQFDSLINFICTLGYDNEAPPKAKELAKQLTEAKDETALIEQQTLTLLAVIRDQPETLAEINDYLEQRMKQPAPPPTPASPPRVWENIYVEHESYPFARFATFFSVVIMGIAGAFVSNYSRVCALLKESTPSVLRQLTKVCGSVSRRLLVPYLPSLCRRFSVHILSKGICFLWPNTCTGGPTLFGAPRHFRNYWSGVLLPGFPSIMYFVSSEILSAE